MSDGFQFHRLPPAWKYELDAYDRLDLPPELELRLPLRGSVDLVGAIEGAVLATLHTRHIELYPPFRWDGVTKWRDGHFFMRASAYHDVGCEMVDKGLIPPSNQKIFDKILVYVIKCEHDADAATHAEPIRTAKRIAFALDRRAIYRAVRIYQSATTPKQETADAPETGEYCRGDF